MKTKTSIVMDEDVWKEARKKAIDLDINISLYVENLIKEDLSINGN